MPRKLVPNNLIDDDLTLSQVFHGDIKTENVLVTGWNWYVGFVLGEDNMVFLTCQYDYDAMFVSQKYYCVLLFSAC